MLVHDKLNEIQSVNRSGPFRRGCAMCQLIIEKTGIGRTGSKAYEIKGNIDFNSVEVVYMVLTARSGITC